MDDITRALVFIIGFGAVFVGLIALEAAICVKRGRGDIYDFKETLANLATGASYKIVDGIAIAVFITVCYDFVAQYGLQWKPSITAWSVVATIVAADFCMFIQHCAAHKIRWFWVVHSTHHSSANMNLSTALRQNFLNALTGSWILLWLPLALIGFDKNWALLAIEGNLIYQFFQHSQILNAPKWAGKVFNTPSHHRVHHGRNPAQIDRNFGGVLIVWDKVFGTFQAEETAGKILYGVPRMPAKPYNPLHLQTHELFEMIKDIARYKDLRILWMPPEWADEKRANEEIAQSHGNENPTPKADFQKPQKPQRTSSHH